MVGAAFMVGGGLYGQGQPLWSGAALMDRSGLNGQERPFRSGRPLWLGATFMIGAAFKVGGGLYGRGGNLARGRPSKSGSVMCTVYNRLMWSTNLALITSAQNQVFPHLS